MSSRGKKITSTLWYSCDKCCCYISHKDLQDHQLNYCTSINENNVENIICDWKQVFIRNGTFYGFLEDCKLPDSSNIISSDVILLSQSAMQLCQFVIGDPVVIASKVGEINTDSGNSYFNYHHEVKIVWPTVEGAVTSAFCPKQGLELSWGLSYGPVQVMKLQSSPIPASDIVFNFTKSTDVPEKIDCFINLLRFQMIGKIFHVNSRIAVEFYGKKLKLIISNIEPSKSNAGDSEVDSKGICDLIEDMKKLDMSMSNFVASSSDSSNSTCSVGGVFYQCFENTKWCLRNDLSNMISSESKTFNQGKWNLNDIGGYKDVLNDLDYMINSSLKKSDNDFHFKSIRSAKGVLLYGLHGVGKTHIAHALAYRSGAYSVAVQSSNLFSKFYGEAESRLRSIFEEALLHTPSFMILDDIDTICPKRGGSDQERRVVATLLSLLDSLDGHDVFVLATTSQIHIIDPAIRRPGRLDHEIELSVPSLSDREDILMKMLKQPGLFDDEDVIRKIASVAHGYVGADLSAVVAQAFTRASQINDNVITADILQWALTQVKPSAMREVLVKVPNVKWSDIGGQDRLKLQLRQAVEWPLNHPEAFARLGITPPRGILMFGPPGCSKTMIAKALATESKLNFISIKGPELFSKWVGESERAVRAVFKRARSVAPSIVFLDELDAIAGERSSEAGGSANVQERVLAQLLTELDGVEPLRNVIIVAATNRPDRIDKALLRPGRLDRLIYVPLPDLATRRQILQLQFHKTPVSSDVDVNMLADLMDGYSGAEVVATCHEAALNALEEDSSACEVKLCNFEYALSIVTPRTPKSILDLYERYISQ